MIMEIIDDEMEFEPDIREQQFHSAVREYVVSHVLSMFCMNKKCSKQPMNFPHPSEPPTHKFIPELFLKLV